MTKKNLTGFREQEECFSREEGERSGTEGGKAEFLEGGGKL